MTDAALLEGWHRRAGVRRDPRRWLGPDEADGRVFFPPGMVPVTANLEVGRLGPDLRRRLLVEHLYRYLDFTVNFELKIVNVTAERMALDRTGFELPEQVRLGAYGIYCDEGYHALCCADLCHQVAASTGIACQPPPFDPFERRLAAIAHRAPPPLKPAVELLQVIVFETLVSGILAQVPEDPDVVPCVREAIRDHARDERHHHAFFASLFSLVWPQLSAAEQGDLGPLLPSMILQSLTPDYEAIAGSLVGVGLTPERARAVVRESYLPAALVSGIRATARATVDLFKRNGLLEHADTHDAFIVSGLLAQTQLRRRPT